MVDAAAARGLPVELLVQKALEGGAKGVPADRVIAAVRALAGELDASAGALHSAGLAAPDGDAIEAGAFALTAGLKEGQVRELARASRTPFGAAATLRVAALLAALGVPAKQTVALVRRTIEAGRAPLDLLDLPDRVESEIARGATPAQAAAGLARAAAHAPVGPPDVPPGRERSRKPWRRRTSPPRCHSPASLLCVDSSPHAHRSQSRLSAHRRRSRAEARDGGLLGRQGVTRPAAAHRRRAARRSLAPAARRRPRPRARQRLLLLRSRSGHVRDGGGRTRALWLVGGDRRSRHLLRDGARQPGQGPRGRGGPRGHRDGNDEVVRHELPLYRPGARTGAGVPPRLDQGRGRVPGGQGAGPLREAGARRPRELPAARQGARSPRRPAGAARWAAGGVRGGGGAADGGGRGGGAG